LSFHPGQDFLVVLAQPIEQIYTDCIVNPGDRGLEMQPVGLTKDAGWEVGVRRTMDCSREEAWRLLTSREGLRCWLGEPEGWALEPGAHFLLPDGTQGEVRVVSASHLRITWKPPGWPRPSTIQVRALASGTRAVLAFHQERLPDADARVGRSAFFAAALDALEALIAQSPAS
jgi:uncharacterized protein YndB with AHSA1/START domain